VQYTVFNIFLAIIGCDMDLSQSIINIY